MSVVGVQEDMFDDWQDKKFIVADRYLNPGPGYLVVLTDFPYWDQHFQVLLSWCEVNGGLVQGMTVRFDTTQELTAFTLRWL
jgi:hypothetical protein